MAKKKFNPDPQQSVLYHQEFSRLLTLSAHQLLAQIPEHAIDIITSRSMFNGVVNMLCADKRETEAAVPELPHKIDFKTCYAMEVVETSKDISDNVLIRLHGAAPKKDVLYQTAITHDAWDKNKEMLAFADRSLRASMGLKPQVE